MNKATMHIKVDADVKAKSAKLAEKLGLPLSVIVNASLKNFIRTETFMVSSGEPMTPYMESWLSEIEADKKKGKNTSKKLNSLAELKADLLS